MQAVNNCMLFSLRMTASEVSLMGFTQDPQILASLDLAVLSPLTLAPPLPPSTSPPPPAPQSFVPFQ